VAEPHNYDVMDVVGYRAAVGSSSAIVRRSLQYVLRGFDRIADAATTDLPHYELEPVGGEWQVTVDGAVVHQGGDFLIALGTLEFHLLTAAVDRNSYLFHVHGAALCAPTCRAGIILAGDSGIGKTTMALALMLRGFTPFSDDVALIDPQTMSLQPLRRAFHINADTWPLLEGLAGGQIRSEADDVTGYFAPAQWAHAPVPVKWVLFPERVPGGTPQLLPLQPAQAASALIENSGTLTRSPRLALSTISRLVEHATCCRFIVSDLERSVALVQKLVLSDAVT